MVEPSPQTLTQKTPIQATRFHDSGLDPFMRTFERGMLFIRVISEIRGQASTVPRPRAQELPPPFRSFIILHSYFLCSLALTQILA
jgi:hypothetical protein